MDQKVHSLMLCLHLTLHIYNLHQFTSATQILLGVLLFCVSKTIEVTGGPESLSRNSYVAICVTLVQLRCQELNATDTHIYSTYIHIHTHKHPLSQQCN